MADDFVVIGVVKEVLGDGYFKVELPNKHIITAHAKNMHIASGDEVTIEISPINLSTGRIIVKNNK